jgi:hypothetical protein
MYAAVQRIRHELSLVQLHYPITFHLVDADAAAGDAPTLEVRAAIMLPELQSKVVVVYDINAETLLGWPECVGGLGVRVERVYGGAE